jgi:hypothetical protein
MSESTWLGPHLGIEQNGGLESPIPNRVVDFNAP